MQIFAYENERLIRASFAQKGKDYTCPECKERVRLRGGRARQLHFFHPNPKITCANHRKSPIHLQTQLRLAQIFSSSQMEYYFSEINRFADLADHKSKLIFEVQCSPISLREVRARQEAYAKTGYFLVWILHEKNFNKRYLSDAEKYLRDFPFYYTNIDGKGRGMIYDQLDMVRNVKRLYIVKKCPVLLTEHFYFKRDTFSDLPEGLKTRGKKWPLFFKGDLLHRIWKSTEFEKILHTLEKRAKKQRRKVTWKKTVDNALALHEIYLTKKLLLHSKRK